MHPTTTSPATHCRIEPHFRHSHLSVVNSGDTSCSHSQAMPYLPLPSFSLVTLFFSFCLPSLLLSSSSYPSCIIGFQLVRVISSGRLALLGSKEPGFSFLVVSLLPARCLSSLTLSTTTRLVLVLLSTSLIPPRSSPSGCDNLPQLQFRGGIPICAVVADRLRSGNGNRGGNPATLIR